MTILAFDTSQRSVSVAVATTGRTVARLERPQQGPAETLLPLIEAVLAEAGVGLREVTRIATTLGPGGFTGIRVGLAMAQGLALATGAELVGIGSLDVMAAVVAAATPSATTAIVVAAEAGRGGVYAQVFGCGDPVTPLSPPVLLAASAAAHTLAIPAEARFAGAGGPTLAAWLGRTPAAIDTELQPDAARLVVLAPRLTPGGRLRPLYLRSADAAPARGAALVFDPAAGPERP
jgi:tRNA threonylcarbamoyl adenosine modification protein YeaZ